MIFKYGVLIGGLIIVVGGGYLLFGGAAPTTNDVNTKKEASSVSGTLPELFGRGGSYRCDIGVDDAQSVAGVVYIADEKIRVEVTSATEEGGTVATMISADGSTYTWSDEAPFGVKVHTPAVSPEGGAPAMSGEVMSGVLQYEWECAPWTPDPAFFTPPSNVQFMDAANPSIPQIPVY